jgi:hypothetical protein
MKRTFVGATTKHFRTPDTVITAYLASSMMIKIEEQISNKDIHWSV